MNLSFSGNIVTINELTANDLVFELVARNLDQASISRTENGTVYKYSISFAMRKEDHVEFAGQIHRHNNENKLGKKLDTGSNKPDNDPTPPGRGGGAKVVDLENTFAIAA